MAYWTLAMTAVTAYLVGSLPTGYVAGRLRGVDIRKVGSGNIGATNVMRTLGMRLGLVVFAIDAAKGYVACRHSMWLAGELLGGSGGVDPVLGMMVGGFAAILGHNYTPWLRFKGGKGIATSAGVLGALMPAALGWAFAGFAVVFGLSRIVSLGSLTAAAVLPFAAGWSGLDRRLTGLAVLMSALAIYKHRANIQRLLAGTEPRLGGGPAKAAGEREGT